jgi:transcriptional regulator with XRE-family HTH domain
MVVPGTVRRVTPLGTVIQRAIRAERARVGLTQSELAKRLGWSRQVITNIENGDRSIGVHELPALCKALGVTLNELSRDADPEDRAALGF